MTKLPRDRWEQVEAVLDHALELEGEARSRYLALACGEDRALRAEVEALLEADARSGVLDRSLPAFAQPLLTEESQRQTSPLGPGERVGPYRLLRVIGVGGMGAVFLAERADGQFEQRVALKLVRDSLAGGLLSRRFLEERRILAGLEHPQIARLLDGGVTPEGLPYFAMEFVDGEPLSRYCDARRLPIERRLRIFLDVCDAVSYAHRQLVVHRDLKPANILVGADGQVKLLDFGIAKLTDPGRRPTGSTGTVLGWLTPEYASPEQLRGEAVSTASDVYSLGVILYELLCGLRPFAESTAPHEFARSVIETDAPPPSAAATSSPSFGGAAEQPADVFRAAARSTTPVRLRRRLRGDLDAVVLRAMRKEPGARYATVDDLAADIRRHLAGHPVAARRATRAYLARRFVVRHRVSLVAVLLLGSAAGAFGWAHTRAVARERDTATAEATRAEQVSAFLIDLFAQSDPLGVGVGPRPVTEFLALGADRLRAELADQPDLRASMLRAIGKLYENLGNYEEADAHFGAVLELRRGQLAEGHPNLLESFQDLGGLRRRQGNLAEADSILGAALALADAGFPTDRLAGLLDELAEVRRLQGDLVTADSLFRQVHGLYLERFGPADRRVASALTSLGVVARQRGDLDAAERYHGEALASRRAHFGENHAYVAESMRNLAIVLHSGGRYSEARRLYEDALVMQIDVLGDSHPQLGPTRNSYGALLREMGEHQAALEQYRQVLVLQRAALGGAHPRLAASITNLANVHRELGDLGEAEALAREGYEMRLGLLEPDHPSVAHSLNVLGVVLRDAGRYREAEEYLSSADRIYSARLGADHPSVAVNRVGLALTVLAFGEADRALPLFRQALDIQERASQPNPLDLARTLHGIGRALLALGRPGDAEPHLRRSLELRRAHLTPEHPEIDAVLDDLRGSLISLGRTAEVR